MSRKKKVSYFYDPDIGQFYYGQGHPMKPHRIRLTHSLVLHYGLHKHMEVLRPTLATKEDMMQFHSEDYIDFLRHVTPDNEEECSRQIKQFALVEDCPVFDGMYKFSQISAGGSLGGAVQLNYGMSDCVINWAGGLHHAKKSEGSGFCYVNDIVLAILELLKYTHRVLYIDIDVHHGDGVEEAFLTTDRVMTVSFHKFGDKFFPGTGDVCNVGYGAGKYYTVNVPLRNGITDDAYDSLFKPLLSTIMDRYQPGAIVFQCGADSLAGDRLGLFNLSIKGHARCLQYMKSFGVPLMVLGGGGYKQSNVARCWAYETGVVLGEELSNNLPPNEYLEYYAPDYQLHIPTQPHRQDLNAKEHLEKMKRQLLEGLRHVHPVGAPFHARPPDGLRPDQLQSIDLTEDSDD